MRVLVLSNQPNDSGSRERLRAIAGLETEIYLGTPGGTAGADGPIRLIPIPVKGDPKSPDRLRWNTTAVRRLLTDTRPALVHCEADADTPLAGTVSALCRKLKIPYIIFSTQSVARRLGFLDRRRARRVLEHAAGVQGGSRLAMDRLHDQAPEALATALPRAGVALPPPQTRPEREALSIGFAGRLTAERGADILVSALGHTFGRWRLVVAGTGPEQEALERSIQTLGLAARVRWLGGIRPEVIDTLWQEIDCLVVPSRDTPTWVEGHSALLLEAMGRGIAAVVTNAGALPEQVGPAGAVVAGAEAMTDVLQKWVADPAACRAAGIRARQWVLERYVTSVVAGRTVEFWSAVLTEARSGPSPSPNA